MVLGGVISAVLWLSVSSAMAGQSHVFAMSFGTQGSAANEVSSPQGVAVNEATGDVYVADTGNARIDEFDSSGTFIRAWGWGVADGASSFETCTASCQAGVSGSGAGQFETPTMIAVDNSAGPSAGDVYVGDTGDNLVTKFTAAGAIVSSWGSGGQLDGSTASGGPFGALAGVAVDTGGNLWVFDIHTNMFEFAQDDTFIQHSSAFDDSPAAGVGVDSSDNLYAVCTYYDCSYPEDVEVFSPTNGDIGTVTNGSVTSITGLAVDASTGAVYVDDAGSGILSYSSAPCGYSGCTPAESFGSGEMSGAAGLAVDSATGAVYAADSGDQRIDVFAAPDVITGQATNSTTTGATLNGTVNPQGTTITTCEFEYVDQADYNPGAADPYSAGQTVPCTSTPSGSSPDPVSATIGGLTPGTPYHFRLVAANANGSDRRSGPERSRLPGRRSRGRGQRTSAAARATLHASLNPNGSDATYHFEYGTSSAYGTSLPVPDADAGSGTARSRSASCSPGWRGHLLPLQDRGDDRPARLTDPTASSPPSPHRPPARTACPNAALRTG